MTLSIICLLSYRRVLLLCSLWFGRQLLFFFFLMIRRPPISTLFPYTPLSRSIFGPARDMAAGAEGHRRQPRLRPGYRRRRRSAARPAAIAGTARHESVAPGGYRPYR